MGQEEEEYLMCKIIDQYVGVIDSKFWHRGQGLHLEGLNPKPPLCYLISS